MSIHIAVYAPNAVAGRKPVHLDERKFENVWEAKHFISLWASTLGLNEKTTSELNEVIEATKSEYVGTEHDLQRDDDSYSMVGISIEGTLVKEEVNEVQAEAAQSAVDWRTLKQLAADAIEELDSHLAPAEIQQAFEFVYAFCNAVVKHAEGSNKVRGD